MKKKIIYILFIIFSLGILIVNIPVKHLEYGVNEYKKNIFIFYLSVACLLYLLFILLNPKNQERKFSYISGIPILIFAYNSIRVFFIENYQLENLFPLWASIIFYFFFIQILQLVNNVKIITIVVILIITSSFLFQLGFGFLQLLGILNSYNNYFEITGTFSNPNYYSIYLSSTYVFIAITYFTCFRRNFLLLLIFGTLSILAVYLLIYILSRSALIGIFISLLLFLYSQKPNLFYKVRKFRFFAFLFLVSGLIFISYFIKKDSADGRLVIWKVSENIISDHFIYGIGYNRFCVDYNIYQSNYFAKYPIRKQTEGFYVDNTETTLNDFYQIFCEQGIIGLVLILLLAGSIGFLYFHNTKRQAIRASVDYSDLLSELSVYGILVLFIACQFTDTFEQFPLLILFYLCVALIDFQIGINVMKLPTDLGFQKKIKAILKILNLGFALVAIYMAYRTYELHKVLININREVKSLNMGCIKNLPLNNKYFLNNKMNNYMNEASTESNIAFLESCKSYTSYWKVYLNLGIAYLEKKDYQNAEINLLIAHNMIPNLVYPKYLLAKVYLESSQMVKWYNMAHKILEDKEKIPSPEVNMMRVEIKELLVK